MDDTKPRQPSGEPRPVPGQDEAIPQVNEILFDKYLVIDASLGGGMCVVRICRDLETGAEYAFKTPRSIADADVADFLREAEFWLAIAHHPNIAAAHGLRWQGERPYLMVDAIGEHELRTWRDFLQHHPAVPPIFLLQLLSEVVEAMSSLSRKREMVHLDLKPSNLLIDGDRTLVADFGLAATVEVSEGRFRAADGATVVYAAPEVLRDEPVGATADVWSLGVVLFELATGQGFYPFAMDEGDVAHKILDHLSDRGRAYDLWGQVADLHTREAPLSTAEYLTDDDPDFVDRHRAELDERDEFAINAVTRIAQGCIARDPHDRWDDFHDIRSALRLFHQLEPPPREEEIATLRRRANIMVDLGRKPEAVALLSQLLELQPIDEEAWVSAVDLLNQLGAADEARSAHSRRPLADSGIVLLGTEVST